jgi:hypothetical protein
MNTTNTSKDKFTKLMKTSQSIRGNSFDANQYKTQSTTDSQKMLISGVNNMKKNKELKMEFDDLPRPYVH